VKDDFFENLEEEINNPPKNIEPVAFNTWEERGLLGNHTKKKTFPQCYHSKKTLDEGCRMVRCDECNAYLDPFDSLFRLICDQESKQRHVKRLKDEIQKLVLKLHELKKELISLNGKIKRRKTNLNPGFPKWVAKKEI